jgi:hypothetical protein
MSITVIAMSEEKYKCYTSKITSFETQPNYNNGYY